MDHQVNLTNPLPYLLATFLFGSSLIFSSPFPNPNTRQTSPVVSHPRIRQRRFYTLDLRLHNTQPKNIMTDIKQHVYATGFLRKQGKSAIFSQSHRRFFALVGETLSYFRSEADFENKVNQLGAITLREAKSAASSKKTVTLLTSFRTFIFTAADPSEAEQWTLAIQAGIERVKRKAHEAPKTKTKLAVSAVLGDIRLNKLQTELDRVRTDLANERGEKQTVQNQLHATSKELAATKQAMNAVKSELEDAFETLSDTKVELSQANEAIDDLRSKYEESEKKVAALNSQLKTTERSNMLKRALAKTIADSHDHKAVATIEELQKHIDEISKDLDETRIREENLAFIKLQNERAIKRLEDDIKFQADEMEATRIQVRQAITEARRTDLTVVRQRTELEFAAQKMAVAKDSVFEMKDLLTKAATLATIAQWEITPWVAANSQFSESPAEPTVNKNSGNTTGDAPNATANDPPSPPAEDPEEFGAEVARVTSRISSYVADEEQDAGNDAVIDEEESQRFTDFIDRTSSVVSEIEKESNMQTE